MGLSLDALSRAFSSQWLLLLLSREGLFGAQASVFVAPGPYSAGSVLSVLGLGDAMVCGVFQGQRLNLRRLHWGGFLTTEPAGKPGMKSILKPLQHSLALTALIHMSDFSLTILRKNRKLLGAEAPIL